MDDSFFHNELIGNQGRILERRSLLASTYLWQPTRVRTTWLPSIIPLCSFSSDSQRERGREREMDPPAPQAIETSGKVLEFQADQDEKDKAINEWYHASYFCFVRFKFLKNQFSLLLLFMNGLILLVGCSCSCCYDCTEGCFDFLFCNLCWSTDSRRENGKNALVRIIKPWRRKTAYFGVWTILIGESW